MAAQRIPVSEAHHKMVEEPSGALLVCAYDDETSCKEIRIDHALSMKEFRAREARLRRDQEIIFYCA